MAEDLITKLAGIAGPADDHRGAVEAVQAADGQAEPAQFLDRRLGGRRPDDLLEDVARQRSLNRHVAVMVGRGPHPGVQPALLGLFPEPEARLVVAADPAEVRLAQPEDGAVVYHAAVVVTHRGIDDAAHGQLLHVARDAKLHQRLGIRPRHFVFAQGRQVHDDGLLARGPVFGGGAVVRHLVRQPVAVVFDEVARMACEAVVESGLLRLFQISPRCFAPANGALEIFGLVIEPHLDVGRVPAVGRVDIAGAGGRDADNVRQRPKQHVVARTRPGVVHADRVGVVQQRVEEVVDRRPAASGPDAEGGKLAVDVVRTVDMAGIAQILVIARGTGQPERVMPPDRVLHDLDQRLVIDGEVLRVQPRHRVERAHQRTGRRRVDLALQPPVERAERKSLEVGAFAALHVEDLDELPGLHDVGKCLAGPDVLVQKRVGQRIGRFQLILAVRHDGAADIEHDLGRRPVVLRLHRPAGGTDDQEAVHRSGEGRNVAGAGAVLEHLRGIRLAKVEPRSFKRAHDLAPRRIGQKRRFQPPGIAPALRADHRGIGPPVMRKEHQFDRLQPLTVLDRDLVAPEDRHGAAPAARHRMAFDARRQHRQAGDDDTGPFEGSFQNGLHGDPALNSRLSAIAAKRLTGSCQLRALCARRIIAVFASNL